MVGWVAGDELVKSWRFWILWTAQKEDMENKRTSLSHPPDEASPTQPGWWGSLSLSVCSVCFSPESKPPPQPTSPKKSTLATADWWKVHRRGLQMLRDLNLHKGAAYLATSYMPPPCGMTSPGCSPSALPFTSSWKQPPPPSLKKLTKNIWFICKHAGSMQLNGWFVFYYSIAPIQSSLKKMSQRSWLMLLSSTSPSVVGSWECLEKTISNYSKALASL